MHGKPAQRLSSKTVRLQLTLTGLCRVHPETGRTSLLNSPLIHPSIRLAALLWQPVPWLRLSQQLTHSSLWQTKHAARKLPLSDVASNENMSDKLCDVRRVKHIVVCVVGMLRLRLHLCRAWLDGPWWKAQRGNLNVIRRRRDSKFWRRSCCTSYKYTKCGNHTNADNTIYQQLIISKNNVTSETLLLTLINYTIIRVAPDLTFWNPAGAGPGRMYELKSGRSRIWLKLAFGSQNNTPVIKLMASTMLTAAIEAVQFSASFDVLLFASVW